MLSKRPQTHHFGPGSSHPWQRELPNSGAEIGLVIPFLFGAPCRHLVEDPYRSIDSRRPAGVPSVGFLPRRRRGLPHHSVGRSRGSASFRRCPPDDGFRANRRRTATRTDLNGSITAGAWHSPKWLR
jgi:hypothetical protein